MKWLWITALLFLVTGVKSGPPTRKVGDIVDTTITRIARTVKEDTGQPDTFQFTLKEALTGAIGSLLVLEVQQDGKPEVPESVKVTDTQQLATPTFVADLTQYSPGEATFLITALDESTGITAEANADIKSFPNFPGNTATQNLFDPRDTLKKKILLRVEGSLGDMLLRTDEALIIGSINYFAFEDIDSVDYLPCKHCDTVEVCDKELTHSDTTGTKIDDTIVSSAVLAHGSDGNATIKLTFQVPAAAAYETILIPQPPQGNVLCTDATCIIKWSDPSSAVLQLIIIQQTTGQDPDLDTWATYSFDIHDRELVVTNLGDTILEGRWKMLTDEKTYILTKTPGTEGETNSIEVDCSHLADMCFGYFPHVEGGSKGTFYTLTVEPKTKNGNLNQTESVPIEFPAPVQPKLEILSRHTTTHQNQQRADVQICFQHLTPTEGRSFSHYEMLIINEKGQWLKHSLIQEEEEGGDASGERLCFAPFTINTTDFALTEATRVVVSQRAVDGISVLASGESALF